MNKYVDTHVVDAFTDQTTQALAEAIEFAVEQRKNMGESNKDEERQAAQDALVELTQNVVDAAQSAYEKSLADVDYSAISAVFEKLAVKAKIHQHLRDAKPVEVVTRKGSYRGELVGWSEKDGEKVVAVREGSTIHEVPEVSVLEILA